ncbi:restriction endonuclease subunit S [Faecalicatena contorta]|uniref:restriction endonuclease subunit S n=1 Tax=Faecalicatena contorta TaxID=39482 RepID=UPI001F224692|nr:restriction endonuclease subunit S [Faecalicatena contorta]MCF2682106.1 restriction endonuclease subunit S [Faecalicatena contorta]
MEENRKKPQVRFDGYTDDWEQRKLGDLVDVCSGRDYKHLSEGDIPVYGTGGYMLSVSEALSYDKDAIGIGRKGTIDKPYILNAPFWTVDTLFYAIPREKIDLNFAFDIFQNIDWKKKDESTGVPSLSKTAINEIEVLVPQYDEQQALGQFFNGIDNLITLHQRKHNKLVDVKKSMLEKMFPKNGEKKPEIRFCGFTNDWEQRKLGEVAIYRRGSFPQPYGKSEWYDGDGAMPFVQVADVSDEMNLVEDTKQKISILAQPMSVFAEKNSVLVTLQGSIGRVAITQYGAFVDRTVLIFEKYKAEIDKTFWAYIIKQKFIDEARKAPGGTIKTITKEALSDFELSIPNYQEQKQIGAYFRNLDDLITLHQREVEKLKNIKKSMLEKMFI